MSDNNCVCFQDFCAEIEELKGEIERRDAENKQLRAEIERLRAEIDEASRERERLQEYFSKTALAYVEAQSAEIDRAYQAGFRDGLRAALAEKEKTG